MSVVERMRQEGILADSRDISAYLQDAGDSERKSRMLLERLRNWNSIFSTISRMSRCGFHASS